MAHRHNHLLRRQLDDIAFSAIQETLSFCDIRIRKALLGPPGLVENQRRLRNPLLEWESPRRCMDR
jgi:hypothetical protein